MTLPYLPVVLSTPISNPATASQGPPPVPYISNSVYQSAPDSVFAGDLLPGSFLSTQPFALADEIRRASRWVDEHCLGADATDNQASLAGSLSVESVLTRVKSGQLRLVCDYRPIRQVIGIDIGPNPGSVQSIGSDWAAAVSIGRRTLTVPMYGVPVRQGDVGNPSVAWSWSGGIYAVWSYVYGWPHTMLAASVTASATSCVVQSTDGMGGVWGILPTMTSLLVSDTNDGTGTETVAVSAVTPNVPSTGLTTLTTAPFQYNHTPPTFPDFIPVSAIPDTISRAAVFITNVLIKARGARANVMPSTPGGNPDRKALAQAGATGDWAAAMALMHPHRIRSKTKV